MEDSAKLDSSSPPSPGYIWVATQDDFDGILPALRAVPRLAIDIEADSLYHYFEKVCLIQISTDCQTYILDPLSVSNLQGLAPILCDPDVEKVFHAAGYDTRCLMRDFGFSFASIFDTHMAAQLIGYEFLGLSALLEKLLGVVHSKQRQRDDWSRRPLNSEQLQYAAMDTHHLLRLRDVLELQLREKGRLPWAREEFEATGKIEGQEKEFDPDGYRKIKGSRELPPPAQAIVRALYLLRDRCAREMDVPPFKVINNFVLIDIAKQPPQSSRDLFKRQGISYRVARRYGDDLLQAIETARSTSPSPLDWPARSSWRGPTSEARLRLENLKSWRAAKAKELGLPSGVVFPGAFLEMLAAAPPANLEALSQIEGIRHWRVGEFGEEVFRILTQ